MLGIFGGDYRMNRDIKIMDAGFVCDYTIWRQEYFEQMDLEQVSAEAVTYAQNHPHNGKKIRI